MKPRTAGELERALMRLDGRGYKSYQELRGLYAIGPYAVEIARVQADPYAPPSRLHARIGLARAGLAEAAAERGARLLALEDFLGRALERGACACESHAIAVDGFGQEVLERTVVQICADRIEARLFVRLPAAGRRVLGRRAAGVLLDELPRILDAALLAHHLDAAALRLHQDVVEDHAHLRAQVAARGWVAFVADGAVLPRRAGHDDRPLAPAPEAPVVPFRSPETLRARLDLPHAGQVSGMAIPGGVTLLVGGGFHGKSTLLEALARGIYPHVPGDGRERVAADPRTVKLRAEEGRAVTRTDISPFIGELPFGSSTADFSTTNASGSTSQAANTVEALEAGARVLLIDEDTSATNFMIRDEPMRRLLRPGQEPIRPFLDRVRNLFHDRGVSTVLVVGGSGEYFRVADRVVLMDRYVPVDATARAREILPAEQGAGEPFPAAGAPRRFSLARYRGHGGPRGPRVKAVGTHRILIDREEVDLSACEQLVSPSQTRTLAEILSRLLEGADGEKPWSELGAGFAAAELQRFLESVLDEERALGGTGRAEEAAGLDRISRTPRADLAGVRSIEVLALIHRLRALRVEERE